jgi:hypothetical protein
MLSVAESIILAIYRRAYASFRKGIYCQFSDREDMQRLKLPYIESAKNFV